MYWEGRMISYGQNVRNAAMAARRFSPGVIFSVAWMKTEVRIAPQVEQFVKSRALEPRQALRKAIKALVQEEGDIKALEGKLAGWHRLRVSAYRVLYKETAEHGIRVLNSVYAKHRSVVYELFQHLLSDELAS